MRTYLIDITLTSLDGDKPETNLVAIKAASEQAAFDRASKLYNTETQAVLSMECHESW